MRVRGVVLAQIRLLQYCCWVLALYLIAVVISFVGVNNYWLNTILIG